MRTLRVREEESKMTAQRCDFCSYIGKIHMKYAIPVVPMATEIVETPNGRRHLCAKHARDAVRVSDTTCRCGQANCTNCHWRA